MCVQVPIKDGTVGDAKRALLSLLRAEEGEEEGGEGGREGVDFFLFKK